MKFGDLKIFICEKEKLNATIEAFCNKYSLKILAPENLSELSSFKFSADLAICYGCGIIFNSNIINRFKHGIWNIHTGKLPQMRPTSNWMVIN